MKTIGLIGGMSWESTESYYRLINETVKVALGGLHSAKLVLVSVDFAEIEKLQHQGKWKETGNILSKAAQSLEKAGADFILICTNTMHLVAPQIQAEISVPLLHIADATAEEITKFGISKIGLLGTAFTMEEDFYKSRLENEYGLEVVTPNQTDRKIIHQIIYDELCLGKIEDASRKEYLRIIDTLTARGAEGVILGCTEIALLVKPEHTATKLFDTTRIHALKAVEKALS
ncbi:MAG TPA: aspartate/glutamate racemase family protein [Flavobacteriaceae bacterium]|nr:aspartate/glutamate racemase family protein [Flavobacteriaceae bacterium]